MLKRTFGDISLLYRNYFHWIISKIIFICYGFIIALLVFLPFFLVSVVISGGVSTFLNILLTNTFSNIPAVNWLYIIGFVLGTFAFEYSNILLLKLYKSYLDGKKPKFFSHDFLNFKLMWKFILLSLLLVVVFLVPIFIFFFIIAGLVMLNGGLDAALMLTTAGPLNTITIISFILFIVLILVEFYVFYKFVFSYMELADDGEKKDVSKLVKTSLKNTKGWKKFISFVKVFFVAGLLYLPFFAVIADLSTKEGDLELYRAYLGAPLEAQTKFEELNPYALQYLILNYGNKTLEQVEADVGNYKLMLGILGVIMFLVVDGVFFMALSSLYFNKLKE